MIARTVLITGCNRGLGLEMVRQLAKGTSPPEVIIATCRNPEDAKELRELSESHKGIHVAKFDVTDESSYSQLVSQVSELLGVQGLNLLINNAGVAPKSTRINMVKWQQMVDTYTVNTVAPVMLTKALLPHLKTAASLTEGSDLSAQRAAVINVSSSLGSIERNEQGGLYPYRASKSALNAVTKTMSIDLRGYNILVSCICPGWVQTDMGGKNAALTPEKSISDVFGLIQSMTESHHGQFYNHNGKKLPW